MFRAEVFAVEDCAMQLTWRNATDEIDVLVGSRRIQVPPSACGSLIIDHLEPSAPYAPIVSHAGVDQRLSAVTLPRMQGAELARFATVSDLHIGERWFGLLPRVHTQDGEHHGIRGARVAATEAARWGASRLIMKGDLVDHGNEAEWQALGAVVRSMEVPALIMIGNHEVMKRKRLDHREQLAALDVDDEDVRALDLDGLRVVLVNTAIEDRGYGRVAAPAAALDAVAETSTPCLVVLHHHIQALPVPTFWPWGIDSIRGNRFVRALRRANPNVAITTGHSHRNRRRRIDGIEHIEVGSGKDYPGVWAGYVVHEGGLRQVVYRIGDPDHMAWTDRTRTVMFGVWRHFAPGRLRDRCFCIEWQ